MQYRKREQGVSVSGNQQSAELKAIENVIARLSDAFAPQVSSDDVTHTVHEAYRRFEGSKVRDFVPLLVENSARRELTDPSRRPASARSV